MALSRGEQPEQLTRVLDVNGTFRRFARSFGHGPEPTGPRASPRLSQQAQVMGDARAEVGVDLAPVLLDRALLDAALHSLA